MEREAWQPTVCGVARESGMTKHARTTTLTAKTLTSNPLTAFCREGAPFIISSFHIHKPSMESVVKLLISSLFTDEETEAQRK